MNDPLVEPMYWLLIFVGVIGFLVIGDLLMRVYLRTRAWWRSRRVRKSRQALRDVFGGATLAVRPLDRAKLESSERYKIMNTPADRIYDRRRY